MHRVKKQHSQRQNWEFTVLSRLACLSYIPVTIMDHNIFAYYCTRYPVRCERSYFSKTNYWFSLSILLSYVAVTKDIVFRMFFVCWMLHKDSTIESKTWPSHGYLLRVYDGQENNIHVYYDFFQWTYRSLDVNRHVTYDSVQLTTWHV